MAFCPAVVRAAADCLDGAVRARQSGHSQLRVGQNIAPAVGDVWRPWRAAFQRQLDWWSDWLRGIAPSWLRWTAHTSSELATCLERVVNGGELRDPVTVADAAAKSWFELRSGHALPAAAVLHVRVWFELIWERLCETGSVSLCQHVVLYGSVSACAFGVRRSTIDAKVKHLAKFYLDFPRMHMARMPAERYERENGLSAGSLNKWRSRCLEQGWHHWSEALRKRYRFAPQTVRVDRGLPRLGRRFDKYYPDAAMRKVFAYVNKQLAPDGAPGKCGKNVKVSDIQTTLAGVVHDENVNLERIHHHKNKGLDANACPRYLGTGSKRAAMHVRERLSLVNHATKFSKGEFRPDSPEMMAFVVLIRTLLKESVPELLGNIDEMWRRQMRDDRLRSLHHSVTAHIDNQVASPSVCFETKAAHAQSSRSHIVNPPARAVATAEYGAWAGPWHASMADCAGDKTRIESLIRQGATYSDYDAWQRRAQGNAKARRMRGRRLPTRPLPQSRRCDVPPGGRHRKGKTIITFVWASGHRGPAVTMSLSKKIARLANERYAPEHIFHNTSKRSHMVDGELFVWYLDVVVREGLRRQRRLLVEQGREGDSRKRAYVIVDKAPGHDSYTKGMRRRIVLIEKELHMKLVIAPPGYSSVGQPCDQIHRQVQTAEDACMREMVGECRDLRLRTEGMRDTSISGLEEAEVDVRSMRSVTCVDVCRSWVVTGYFCAAEMEALAGLTAGALEPARGTKRKRATEGNIIAAPDCVGRLPGATNVAPASFWSPIVRCSGTAVTPMSRAPLVSLQWATVPAVETKHMWFYTAIEDAPAAIAPACLARI